MEGTRAGMPDLSTTHPSAKTDQKTDQKSLTDRATRVRCVFPRLAVTPLVFVNGRRGESAPVVRGDVIRVNGSESVVVSEPAAALDFKNWRRGGGVDRRSAGMYDGVYRIGTKTLTHCAPPR